MIRDRKQGGNIELSEIIRNYLEEQGISAREFGRRCGFSNAYVSVLITGKHPATGKKLKPTIDTYAKVANGMGISLKELLTMTELQTEPEEPTQPTTPTEPTEPTEPTKQNEQKEQEDMELYIVGSVLTMTAAICGTLYMNAKRKEKLIREHRVYREDAYCKVEKRAQAWEELYNMEHDENIRLKAMLKVCKMIIAQSDFRKGSNKKTEE